MTPPPELPDDVDRGVLFLIRLKFQSCISIHYLLYIFNKLIFHLTHYRASMTEGEGGSGGYARDFTLTCLILGVAGLLFSLNLTLDGMLIAFFS